MDDARRLRAYLIDPQMLMSYFISGTKIRVDVQAGIPPTATLRGASYDKEKDLFAIITQDQSFDHVEIGKPIPIGDIFITKSRTSPDETLAYDHG